MSFVQSTKMLTLTELSERLKNIDEVSLLEVLDISSEELIDRFQDRIEDRFDYLEKEFDEQDNED